MSTKDLAPVLPAKFTTVFGARRCSGNPDAGFARSYSKDVLLSSITPTDTNITPVPLGTSGTTWTFRDTALALYSTPGAAPSNQAAIDALAKQLAQDAVDFLSQSFDIAYNGVAAVPPNGLVDVLELAYGPDDLTTRIRSAPWNGGVAEFHHLDPAISACHADDRYPGLLVDVPGASVGNSMQAVLSLEDGRLVLTYDNTMSVNCGCSSTTCGQICITTQSSCSGNPIIPGATVSLSTFAVASLALSNHGTGYTSPPTVNFPTTTGIGATATAQLTATSVGTLTLGAGGTGYTNGLAYALGLTGGGGTGATGTFDVAGGVVTAVALTAGGAGYTTLPTPDFSAAGAGTGATATVRLTGTTIATVTLLTGGSYSAATTAGFIGGGGTGAVIVVTMGAATTLPSCTTDGQVTAAARSASGSGYMAFPTWGVSGGGGSGAAVTTATMLLTGAAIVNAGTGYAALNLLTVVGGTATTPAVIRVASVTGGVITAVTITTVGSYTVLPTSPVSVTGGAGTGATFNLTWGVNTVAVTAGGTGYTDTPTLTPSGGSATATATVKALCCVPIPAQGAYHATVSAPHYTTSNTNLATNNCTTQNVTVTLVESESKTKIVVEGCNAGGTSFLPGASITITRGAFSASGTTDSVGSATFFLAPGGAAYTIVMSHASFTTLTQTFSVTACGSNTFGYGLQPDASHGCYCSTCQPYPAPNTLFLTDSVYGAVTLTRGLASAWVGSKVISYPGFAGCLPVTVTVSYSANDIGCDLLVSWLGFPCPCQDPGGGVGCVVQQIIATSTSLSCADVAGSMSGTFSFTNPHPLTDTSIYAGSDATFTISS